VCEPECASPWHFLSPSSSCRSMVSLVYGKITEDEPAPRARLEKLIGILKAHLGTNVGTIR
jgi:hypothetical protein